MTIEKLGKHAVFGSMDDCDFEVYSKSLVKSFHLILYQGTSRKVQAGMRKSLIIWLDSLLESIVWMLACLLSLLSLLASEQLLRQLAYTICQ